jgi:mannose-6-phosphate isomerase-like protein (cupin superfamily)
MSDLTTSAPGARARQFVLGQEFRGTILTTAAETDGRHDLTECLQPPGARTPVHLHTRYEERFWVISGSLTMWVGAEKLILRAGDFHAIPMNVPHAVESGPEGAHALHISSPAGFAELIARAGTPAHLATPETEMDLERFMAVTTELGDVVLGPPGAIPADLADADGASRPGSPG